MKTFAKVFTTLFSTKLYTVEQASKEAARIVGQQGKSNGMVSKVKRKTYEPSDKGNLAERIVAYATKRKGHEWSLANCALTLGVDPNSISAQLTHLCHGPNRPLDRIGRGKYRTAA